MIRLAIFDLDGTLIDSADDIIASVNVFFESKGLMSPASNAIRTAIGEGLGQLIYSPFPNAKPGTTEFKQLQKEFTEIYDQHLLNKTIVYPGVFEFCESFSGQTAIVTNKMERQTHRTLQGLKLDRIAWSNVFGVDTLEHCKPHPLPLLEVMRRVGAKPSETIMIGDGFPDILAAKAANVKSIAVEYGYAHIDKLMALGASHSIKSLWDLPEVIARIEA